MSDALEALISHMQPVDIFPTCHYIHFTRHATMTYRLSYDKIFLAFDKLALSCLTKCIATRDIGKITSTRISKTTEYKCSYNADSRGCNADFLVKEHKITTNYRHEVEAIPWRYCWYRI